MANKIAIVTDSTAYIPEALNRQYNIHVVPQVLIWEQKTYRDGVDIKPAEFYQRQLITATHPTTSQATVEDFKKTFEAAAQEADSILTIVLSSDLSGAFNSATQAMVGFGPQKIELIDSRMISMALGYLVLAAARAAANAQHIDGRHASPCCWITAASGHYWQAARGSGRQAPAGSRSQHPNGAASHAAPQPAIRQGGCSRRQSRLHNARASHTRAGCARALPAPRHL